MPSLGGFPDSDLEQALARWIAASVAGDLEGVCALYHPKAVLWGTISPWLCTTPQAVRDYFAVFFNPHPSNIVCHQSVVRVYGDIGMNSGSYTFSFPSRGAICFIDARYSFVYEKQTDGRWLIVDHHSSRMPTA